MTKSTGPVKMNENKVSTLKMNLSAIGVGLLFSFYIIILLQLFNLFHATVWSSILLFALIGIGIIIARRIARKINSDFHKTNTIISITTSSIGVVYIIFVFFL